MNGLRGTHIFCVFSLEFLQKASILSEHLSRSQLWPQSLVFQTRTLYTGEEPEALRLSFWDILIIIPSTFPDCTPLFSRCPRMKGFRKRKAWKWPLSPSTLYLFQCSRNRWGVCRLCFFRPVTHRKHPLGRAGAACHQAGSSHCSLSCSSAHFSLSCRAVLLPPYFCFQYLLLPPIPSHPTSWILQFSGFSSCMKHTAWYAPLTSCRIAPSQPHGQITILASATPLPSQVWLLPLSWKGWRREEPPIPRYFWPSVRNTDRIEILWKE